jgi:ABC-2 type transport system permease protein
MLSYTWWREVIKMFSEIKAECKVIFSFIRIGGYVFFSQRWGLLSQVLGITANVAAAGIFAKLVTLDADIAQYGTPRFLEFFIIAMFISNLVFLGTGSISGIMRGTNFANLYTSRCKFVTIFIGLNAWRIIWRFALSFFFIFVAILLFDAQIYFNLGFLVVFISGFVLTLALDLFAAGFTVITKSSSDPVNWFLGLTSTLVSGTYFPIEKLPSWLLPISLLHPQTYVNKFARLTMGGNASLTEVWPELRAFIATTIIMIIIGFAMFKYGFKRARISGTLGHQ